MGRLGGRGGRIDAVILLVGGDAKGNLTWVEWCFCGKVYVCGWRDGGVVLGERG